MIEWILIACAFKGIGSLKSSVTYLISVVKCLRGQAGSCLPAGSSIFPAAGKGVGEDEP